MVRSSEKYREIFVNESMENIDAIEKELVSLEKKPDDLEVINSVFRRIHSIKGMSSFMGFEKITSLTHQAEEFIQPFKDGLSKPQTEHVDLLLEVTKSLKEMVQAVDQQRQIETDIEHLISRMKKREEGKPPLIEQQVAERRDEEVIEEPNIRCEVYISDSCRIPAARGFLIYRKLSDLCESVRSQPPLPSIKSGNIPNGKIIFDLKTENSINDIESLLSSISEIGKFSVNYLKERRIEKEEDAAVERQGDVERELPPTRAVRKGAVSRTIKVKTEILDDFMDSIGELIIAKSRLRDIVEGFSRIEGRDDLIASVDGLDAIVKGLYEKVMSLRMIPLSAITEKLPVIVRQIARSKGKEVELKVEGSDIEMDRSIVDQIDSPLVHILRNCIDHGIEPPDERKLAGKPQTGRIEFGAKKVRDEVWIEISDDGRGIDPESIKRRSLQLGLIDSERAESMSERDLLEMLYNPKFSTTEGVTDISGRGVGLDVVRTVVRSIGGSVDLETEAGIGTKVILKLPLTAAIINVLLVEISAQKFAIPIGKIAHLHEVDRSIIRRNRDELFITIGDELVRLFPMDRCLGMRQKESPLSETVPIIFVHSSDGTKGFIVDRFLGQQDVVTKPLGRLVENIDCLSGLTILGDGSPVFILDISKMVP